MKKLSIVLLFVFALFTQCSEKTYKVAADRNLDEDVNFDQYKTYAWASQVDNKQNGIFFLNDLVLKDLVRHAVSHELDSRGYDYKQDAPDLVANFRVFEGPVEIRGLTGLGDDYWGVNELKDYDDTRTYKLDEGSIIVQLVERESGKLVWQGYASGLTDGNVFDKNEEKINTAVSKIFDEYPYRADNL